MEIRPKQSTFKCPSDWFTCDVWIDGIVQPRDASPLTWVVTTLLSGMAFLCLPRQFHVAVVEHDHPASLRTAVMTE